MKKYILIITLAAFTTGFAQVNENKTEEKTTVKARVTTSTGVETATKTVTKEAKQSIGLNLDNSGETNQAMVKGAVVVNTDTDYSFGENNFKLKKNAKAKTESYMLMKEENGTLMQAGTLMPTKKNGLYILKMNDQPAMKGYFNAEGQFKAMRQTNPEAKAMKSKVRTLDLDDDGKK